MIVRSESFRASYATRTSCPGWTASVVVIGRKTHGSPSRRLESNCSSTVVAMAGRASDATVSAAPSRFNPASRHRLAYRGTIRYPKPNMATDTATQPSNSLRLVRETAIRLLDHRRSSVERMLRGRRRQRPLQAHCAVPDAGRRLPATAHALYDDVEKQQLTQPEACRTDARNHVEIGKLQRVVGNAPRHSRQTEEEHDEERHVEEHDGQPEMPLAEGLVIHVTGPFRQPVVGGREQRE